MSRYSLAVETTVGRIIPLITRKPRQYAWLLSLVSPLISLNDDFNIFAAFNSKAAKMSSQTMLLENYLNELFPAPVGSTSKIQIIHSIEEARYTFNGSETPPSIPNYDTGHLLVYGELETPEPSTETSVIYLDTENSGALPLDFRLVLPSDINTSEDIFRAILSVVDKYVIDTKKYDTVSS